MSRLSVIVALSLSLGALAPVWAHATTWSVLTRGIDEPAIVFSAADVRAGRLPLRLHDRNIAPVFSQQIVLACQPIPSQPEDVLVYLPLSGQCMPYEDLPKATRARSSALARPVETAATAFGLDGNKNELTALILQPASAIGIAAGLCVCPIEPPTGDDIFKDGFEGIEQ